MKYYIDTEFIEGFKSSYFCLPKSYKQRHFIDLISIGIVCEDGRKYFAISNEFNPNDADQWVKDNVLYPIMVDNGYPKATSNLHGYLGYDTSAIKRIQKMYGKSNQQIAMEIAGFTGCKSDDYGYYVPKDKTVEFYGYYADYDWVLMASLFGKMINLPGGFPMYCIDLKQMLDEKIKSGVSVLHRYAPFSERPISMKQGNSFDEVLTLIKEDKRYPKQVNEHSALSDAEWNKQLHEFILTL